ncbi:hypothetical protein K3217_21130 [bacterium BD-1]|jgi:hypothetical protein|nr:hypothetical protein [Ottowia caeni]
MNKKYLVATLVALVATSVFALLYFNSVPSVVSGPSTTKPSAPVAEGAADAAKHALERVDSDKRTIPTYQPRPEIAQPGVSIKEKVREFAEPAKADPSIALDLSREIAGCAFATSDEVVDQMLGEGVSSANSAERQEMLNEECAGVTDADFLLALDLVDKAASSGLVDAQIEYEALGAQVLDRESFALDIERLSAYRTKAVNYLTSAARQGSPAALYRLSVLYADGHLVPRDANQALRYYQAYLDASGSRTALSLQRLSQLEAAAAAQSNQP